MDLENKLARVINLPDIREIVSWATESPCHRDELWTLVRSENRRISVNALWVMTHLPVTDKDWLESLQTDMIDMLLRADDVAKKRILLQLIREQRFGEDNFRGDLLDFCLTKINSECEPYAVRCFSIYVAFKLCRLHPELIAELEAHLDMLSYQPLSPGLKSALRQTRAKIARLRKYLQDI